MAKINLDRTLTELAALKKSVRAAELKTIELVRNKVEALLSKFEFGSEEPYFKKYDFVIGLNNNGDVLVDIDNLRLREQNGREQLVAEESLDNKPSWIITFQTKLTETLRLKKHMVSVLINPDLLHK